MELDEVTNRQEELWQCWKWDVAKIDISESRGTPSQKRIRNHQRGGPCVASEGKNSQHWKICLHQCDTALKLRSRQARQINLGYAFTVFECGNDVPIRIIIFEY